MPSAIDYALKTYGPEFARVHGLYLEHGFTYSEPGMLALARPVVRDDRQKWLGPDEYRFADAWWVEFVVGDEALGLLYMHIPFNLPYIGWAREFKGKPQARYYDFYKLKRKLINGN